MDQPAIRVVGAGQRFDSGVLALDDVDITIASGEFVSIVGPSGCGKSTLLRLISGLLQPTAGSVEVRSRLVTGPRQDIGMMFQKPTLLPWRTTLENVLLPLDVQGKITRDDRREAFRLLTLVGLDGFEHSYPQHLSGGMQQRVALARLLILGVDVLLLDEPFGAIDEFTREKLNVELLRIHQALKPTIALVTHNIVESVFLSDRVVAMSARPGRVSRTVPIPLERPRRLEQMRGQEFTGLVNDVRDAFETEAAA